MGSLTRGWARLKSKVRATRQDSEMDPVVRAHLENFINSRKGVEAWIEQPTGFNKASILLVADDGEWTRRNVPSPQWARYFIAKQEIPAYDAGIVGYPRRMREWDARKRQSSG